MINCHIHIFTDKNVPNKFLPLKLVKALRIEIIRKNLTTFLKDLLPGERDLAERYANFVEVSALGSQENILKHIQGYYPTGTRFIILPMDMEDMEAGTVPEKLEKQLDDLVLIYNKYPEICIPFVPADPRRIGVTELVKKYVNEHNFKGIKLYPRLGYYPNDERLHDIYRFAIAKKIPVMTHCSKGGVYVRKIKDDVPAHPFRTDISPLERKNPKAFSHYFGEPRNYDEVMTLFPELKMCLAHFGGDTEWDAYLSMPKEPNDENSPNYNWFSEVRRLMKKHSNLYTDISYTIFYHERFFPLLKVLLTDDSIKHKILFGSDFYMAERVKVSEREMSIKLRAYLGEELFTMISETNVTNYLNS